MTLLEAELRDAVLALRLNRPERLNALNFDLIDSLDRELGRAENDDVRVVTLTGAGPSFCSGADVEEVLGLADETAASRFLRGLASVLRRISSLGKPVIAGIHGHAAGGGAELALEADLRIAASDARVWFPDIGMGSTPATVWHLVRMVGEARATEMVMLGQAMDAHDLRRAGAVSLVVERPELERALAGLAARVRDGAGPNSLRLAKRSVRLAAEADRDADLEANVGLMLSCFNGEEQRRAVARFTKTRGR